MTMTATAALVPEVQQAIPALVAELEVQIKIFERDAMGYVRDYLSYQLAGTRRPHAPLGMHHLVAKALRDMALDEAASIRMYGRARG